MSERFHAAAQYGCQVLMQDELRPQVPTINKHDGKQLSAPHRPLVIEADLELSKVTLCLLAGSCLKAHLKDRRRRRTEGLRKSLTAVRTPV